MTAGPATALHGPGWDDPQDRGDDRAGRVGVLAGRLLDSAGLDSVPPPDPLIDGWLQSNSLGWLTGKRGHCKSFVALGMAGAVGSGTHWHGHPVKPARVLYIVAEGLSGFRRRVRAWEDFHQVPMSGVTFLPGPVALVPDAAAIAQIGADLGAGLVIVDTQARVTVGLDENSSRDMGLIISAAEHVRELTGACVLMVHHEAITGDRPRGHSQMDGAATSMLRVVKDGDVVWVANTKQKDGPGQATLSLAVQQHQGTLILVPSTNLDHVAQSESERVVLRCLLDLVGLKGGASHTELKEAASGRGLPPSTFNWGLKRLVTRGYAVNQGKGRQSWYVTVSPGQGTLDSGG